jgi:hypothetical protein
VETRTIAVDFTSGDIYDKIKTNLAGLEVGVLGLYFLFIDSSCIYYLAYYTFIFSLGVKYSLRRKLCY